jgi:nitroreductase
MAEWPFDVLGFLRGDTTDIAQGIIRVVELFEVIKRRRSVRAFAPQAVEAEKVARVLEAANAAPSAGNLQGYEILRVTRKQDRTALARAALGQYFIAEAPLVLVFCANPARSAAKYGERGARLYAVQDATIACTFAMLAATALGLGTVWVGAFNDAAVERVLGTRELVPVAILPIGYAAEAPEPAPRRTIQDLVHDLSV